MKQSQGSIQRSIKALRKINESAAYTPVQKRIAYAVENALRWATEDTVRWDRPEQDILKEAELLETELRRPV